MPKTTAPRTFTGCWTCRRRNVRCDTRAPACTQCKQARISCEGYGFRLVWVDAQTGRYSHDQRRAYPCHRTWTGHPYWTGKEVDRMIECCEDQDGSDDLSPFRVIYLNQSVLDSASELDEEPEESAVELSSGASVLNGRIGDGPHCSFTCSSRSSEEDPEAVCEVLGANANNLQVAIRADKITRICGREATPGFSMDIIEIERLVPPSQSSAERRLFHHFVTSTSGTMVPVHGLHNPWKSIYPLVASQTTSSSSVRSLYHALLTQAAYHLINLKTGDNATKEKARAGHHYGCALRELRKTLQTTVVYEQALAALLAIPLAEHVFRGDANGWDVHYTAAIEFVCQHAPSRPWRRSIEAWTVSQSFALEYLILQTSTSSSRMPDSLHGVLDQLLDEPGFGWTHGGTGHIFRMIYQIRRLEEDLYQKHPHGFSGVMDTATQAQVHSIIHQLEMPVEDQLNVYVEHQESFGIEVSYHMRQSIHLHLRLFTLGVELYLRCKVLRCPPLSVREKVDEALAATADYVDLQLQGSFSIWPVFIAATQAYTPEAKALATYCLQSAEDTGAANRRDVHRLVRQVWLERERLANTLRCCDLGGLFIDWRQVMKDLGLNVLLL